MRNPMRFPTTARVRAFFNRFPDTEGEQATIRVLFCPLVAGAYMYSVPAHDGTWPIDHSLLYTMVVLYGIAAALLFLALAANPVASRSRRVIALLVDASTVTAAMLVTYEYGIAFFGFYMWICLGYGLRYGAPFLRLAQYVTVAGFLAVLLLSPYWHGHLQIGLGLLVTMFYLPPLASLVLERARRARADAEEANRAKSRFVANISHEIRTPLNAIIGFTELFATSRLSHEQESWMKSISSSAALLLSLVNNVLDFARIEAGNVTLVSREFRLRDLIDGVTSVLGPQAAAKGLYLQADDLPADVDILVGDRDHIAQVLINLVANAIKFTEHGGVTLTVSKTAETHGRVGLTWHVVDTGIGMSAEATSRIFESFTQANEDTRRRYGGTGLGTTIAKELVERMGGHIDVHSTLGKGSDFWFSLILDRAQRASVATADPQVTSEPTHSASVAAGMRDDGRHRRILVVEDNAANRKVVAKILERGGYDVDVADSGLSALLNVVCERYDLILLDMELPGVNGLDLLSRLRAQLGSRIRVVMLTANATPEARDTCLAAGADMFLTKPISAPSFLATLGGLLDKRPLDPREDETLNIVSVDRLRQQLALGQDLGFVLEIAELWREDGDRTMRQLDRAVDQGDVERIRKHLHSLQGGAIEIGALACVERCEELRKLLREAAPGEWTDSFARLRSTYEETCRVFDLLASMATPSTETLPQSDG